MRKIYVFTLLFFIQTLFCQDGASIFKQLKKLNTLASVLYVAAHPDDENTRLISLFSNHYNAQTAYLSMTRGDGGQNLIGTELRESLGLIRTQELLEARKIDGGQQYFTTANDFGFSKHPDETLRIWNKDEILGQVVFRIRAFKPDLIIHRFNHRTPGTTHGHHTSSAMLSEQAFHLSNDPNAYPEQLDRVEPWQAERQFYNTSWWAYGGREQFKNADKSNMLPLESNPVDMLLGRTNEEVAAKSRSQHKSQGFGSAPRLGTQTEYLEWINGSKPNQFDPFHGIDTSWNRINGGEKIKRMVDEIIADFDLEHPYKSVYALTKLYKEIGTLEDLHWKTIKQKEVIHLIKSCLGLRVQFNTSKEVGVAETNLAVQLKLFNPSTIPLQLEKIEGVVNIEVKETIKDNQLWERNRNLRLKDAITTPYWLLQEGDLGNYKVENENLKGLAETPNPLEVRFHITINELTIPFQTTLKYRYTDRVAGEVVQNFQLLPRATTQVAEKVILFQDQQAKPIRVQVSAHINNFKGKVQLHVPKAWKVSPEAQQVHIEQAGASKEFVFEVRPPEGSAKATMHSVVTEGNTSYQMSLEEIDYPHIEKQFLLRPNTAIASKIDLNTSVKEVAYIRGAGDKIVESLANVGIQATTLEADAFRLEDLLPFSTVIVGIRAFNVHKALAYKNQILWDYVEQGGTLIVQYNTSRGLDSSLLAPYPLSLSRDRVSDETAQVRILKKDHPLLQHPNHIQASDFDGWVQERGLYFANRWDKRYEAIFSMNDKGETPKLGSLLVADYGKGKFIFTGLSFFRELPAGVPGAYRLFANLISYGK